ncbi:MAG: C40 family peptidase [Solirubrobacteraceae bacterium]
MLRKALIALLAALVLLGPGVGLIALASLLAPALSNAASCGETSGPSLPVSGNVPQSLTAIDANGETITLGHVQLERAATIIAVGNQEQVGRDAQLIALMAAMTESTLRVLANTSAYPQSASYPNDGDGSDEASLGLFQMQPPDGWGTVPELMSPVWSARAFYGGPEGPNHGSPAGLLDVPGWQGMALGEAAQAVEGSAFPERYANYEPVAEKITAALTGATLSGEEGAAQCASGAEMTSLPPGVAGRLIAAAQKEIGLPYVWGGGTYTGPSGQATDGQGPGFDCSGLVLYAAYQASAGKILLAHYTGEQINETQPVAWADKQPGDLIFYTYPGETIPHHVVIYLGGQRILQAPETGQDVGYGTLSEFAGQTASVRRIG